MLVLMTLMLIIIVIPAIIEHFKKPAIIDFTRIKEAQRIIDATGNTENDRLPYNEVGGEMPSAKRNSDHQPVTYFRFNPNGLAVEDWAKLGLSDKQIRVIKNYESKGGKFRKREDLQKIYSLTPADYARLMPYIEIPQTADFKQFKNESKATYKPEELVKVDINTADSARLTEIKGIGPAFAMRILKYRGRLGGFNHKTQLMEIFGLDSAKYSEIEKQVYVDGSAIQKIDINKADFDDLKRNPYLSFKQMNAIIQYRKQHGNFKSAADLKNIVILNEEVIQKLLPYITFL